MIGKFEILLFNLQTILRFSYMFGILSCIHRFTYPSFGIRPLVTRSDSKRLYY